MGRRGGAQGPSATTPPALGFKRPVKAVARDDEQVGISQLQSGILKEMLERAGYTPSIDGLSIESVGMDGHLEIVVIGEPDPATSTLYQRTLGAVFTVLAAPDDATLLELLGRLPVAAVVIEPALFVTDAWSELEALGRVCAAAGIPLIICSTQDERRKGRDLGAAAYLVKPTLPGTLLEIVRQVLNHTAV